MSTNTTQMPQIAHTTPKGRTLANAANSCALNWHIIANVIHCLHKWHLHAESHIWDYAWERVLALILRSCNFCPRVFLATCLLKCPVEFKKFLRLKLLYEQIGCLTNFLYQLELLNAQFTKCPYNTCQTTKAKLMDPCPRFL